MDFEETNFRGLYIVHQKNIHDNRGFFSRTYCKSTFNESNIDFTVVQSNYSFSQKQGTFRGLHMQRNGREENKLIFVTSGEIRDFVLDLRSSEPTFLQLFYIDLSEGERKGILVPKGCAHGFITLSHKVGVSYLVDSEYSAKDEITISPFFPSLVEKLPIPIDTISEKDRNGLRLLQLEEFLE